MKKQFKTFWGRVYILVLLAVVISLVACTAPAPAPTPTPTPTPTPKPPVQKMVIKAVTGWPLNNEVAQHNQKLFVDVFNAAAQKQYPGEFEINFLGGPEVIPQNDQAEAVRKGTIDMLISVSSYYAGVVPEAQVMKFSQLTPWEERKSGAYDVLNQLHQEKLNSFYLGRLGRGLMFQLYTNVKVEKPSDMKGMNLRISPMCSDLVKELGAVPVNIQSADAYNAMKQNITVGYYWTQTGIRDSSWDEVTKYVVGPGFYESHVAVLINMQTWAKIPENIKKLLDTVCQDSEHKVVEENLRRLKEEKDILMKKGIQWIDFSPADTKYYYDLAYAAAGWDAIAARSKDSPYIAKLRPLLTKK